MDQSEIVKRTEEICNEFDSRLEVVGIAAARLELAKALAEREASQPTVKADCRECGYWAAQGASFCHRCGKGIVRASHPTSGADLATPSGCEHFVAPNFCKLIVDVV